MMSDSGAGVLNDVFARGGMVRAEHADVAADRTNGSSDMLDILRMLDELDRQAGRADQALQTIARSISQNATNPQFFYTLACTLRQRRRWQHAADHFRRAIQIKPVFVEAYLGLAAVLRELGQVDDAEDALRRGLDLAPADARVHAELATTLEVRGEFVPAIDQFRRAVELDATVGECWSQLGWLLQRQGESEEASTCFAKALQQQPAEPRARLTRALLALRSGDFAAGWADFDLRDAGGKRTRPLPVPNLVWDEAALSRQTVLVRSEGRTIDEIMFASCFPDLIGRAGHTWIECDASLQRLFQRSFPFTTVVQRLTKETAAADWYRAVAAPDAQIRAGSLPRYLRPSLDAFACSVPYLTPDAQRVTHWRKRLAALGPGMKIGICWCGTRRLSQSVEPTPPLEAWDGILRLPNVNLISLQRNDCSDEIEAVRERQGAIIHGDFVNAPSKEVDDLAALIAALDVVVTVPSIVAHLAGALGAPARTLLSAWPSWRWTLQGDRSPWYPSLRLYRQHSSGGWNDVLEALAQDLKQMAE